MQFVINKSFSFSLSVATELLGNWFDGKWPFALTCFVFPNATHVHKIRLIASYIRRREWKKATKLKSFLQTELLQQKILIACTVKYFTRQEISPRIYFLGIFHASALLLPTDIIKDANYLYIYRLHALLIELKRRRSGIVSAVKITLSRKIHAYNSERVVKYPRLL